MTDQGGGGGFPGGLGGLLEQARGLQERMAKLQEELGRRVVEGSSGGGMVTVIANGRQEIVSIKIEPSAVDPQDVAMLQDLVVAATNVALQKARQMVTEEMGRLTGGLSIPGLT